MSGTRPGRGNDTRRWLLSVTFVIAALLSGVPTIAAAAVTATGTLGIAPPPARAQAVTPTATPAPTATPTTAVAARTASVTPAAPTAPAPTARIAPETATATKITPVSVARTGSTNATASAPTQPPSRAASTVVGRGTPVPAPGSRGAASVTPTETGVSAAGLSTYDIILAGNPTIPNIALSGTRTTTYSVPIIVDIPLVAANFHLTIAGTTFSGSGKTLPSDAAKVTGVACSGSLLCGSVNTVGYPHTINTTPDSFYSLLLGGIAGGNFTLTPTITVTAPPTAAATGYTSTVTIAIAAGP